METQQPKLTPNMFIFVLQELLKTPGINRVNFIQIVAPGGGQIMDALGGALGGSDPRVVVREFTPADLDPVKAKDNPIRFEKQLLGINFEVWGTVPKPWMPAPSMLNLALQEHRKDKTPIPILLMWDKFNVETFEYHAFSQGPPLCEEVGSKLN